MVLFIGGYLAIYSEAQATYFAIANLSIANMANCL
jgi:hypothetical protein